MNILSSKSVSGHDILYIKKIGNSRPSGQDSKETAQTQTETAFIEDNKRCHLCLRMNIDHYGHCLNDHEPNIFMKTGVELL